jgi:peroxiredoxin Q/BCP
MKELTPGDEAPDFSLRDQSGAMVRLSDFRNRRLLLYFYPKADTPGCTIQACSVRDASTRLEDAGVAAVGISPDAPDAQGEFDAKYTLGFPLLADEDHRVAEAYGAWGDKSKHGKTTMGIIRSAFLIDEEGKIAAAWYRVSPEDTVSNVFATS